MDSHYLELKLFLNLTNKEIAEVLEKLEGLQDIETFKELKKEILLKYESKKAIEFFTPFTDLTDSEEPF